ncbi:hypothetical protein PRZ48_011963 [Zasmidium cellare]|uniref:Uncharacterized protein n=1 Tax=Zasmidium cellare TaxID=395010 RepID=A0ABR0E7V8_ZASCE|nr:hypothetical protein PRZ48_011963 [Zasmidium cellare]
MRRLLLGALCLREAALAGAIAVRSANSTTPTQDGTTASSSTDGSSQATGNIGDYIMQGISQTGQEPLPTDTTNGTTTHTTIHSTVVIHKTVTAGAGNDSWQDCQSSLVSWSEEYSKTLSPTVYTTTSWAQWNETYNITSASGDVYTTIDGIPHVRGNFTPTIVGTYMQNFSEPHTSTLTRTLDANFTTPSPTCSIPFDRCSKMWQSYLLSLGITTPLDKATEPAITPMPSNRPRCSIGDSYWSHTVATWDNTCFLSGDRVGLFYWPSATGEASAMPTPTGNKTAAPVTAVSGNFTFTSPSVYLVFNTLSAVQGHDIDRIGFSQSIPLGASSQEPTIVGGYYPEPVGPTLTNKIVSLDPTELSSVIANFGPGVNTASAISEIAHGGPDYAKWISALKDSRPVPTANNSYLIRPVDYAHLTMPDTDAYYLQPSIAPGCYNPHGPHPACSTIWEGAYRAQLLVPQEVRTLAPEWAGCGIPLDGVYDPPQALTEARSEDKPAPPSPAPVVSTEPKTTANPTTPAVKSSEQPKPQFTVSDPLPEVTATPSPQSDPTQQTSTQESASKVPDLQPTESSPSVEQTPEMVPSPSSVNEPQSSYRGSPVIASPSPQSEDDGSQSSPINEPSVTVDPVQPSTTANPPSQNTEPSPNPANGDDGASNTFVVVVGSQTLSVPAPAPSAPAQSEAPVSDSPGQTNALSVLVAASGTEAPQSAPAPTQAAPETPSMAAVVSLADSTIIVASPQHETAAITIGSATLVPGGPAATISGQEVSAGSQGIVVDSQTVPYATYSVLGPAPAQSPNGAQNDPHNTPTVVALVTFGSSSMVIPSPTGSDHAVVLGSATIAPGDPAVTVDGHVVSAASNGIIVDSQMAAYSTMPTTEDDPSAPPSVAVAAVTADGHTYSFVQASGSSAVVIDGQTLSVGTSATTISGQEVSVGTNAVAVGSQTVSFANAGVNTPSPSIVELGTGTFVYGSQTITAGGAPGYNDTRLSRFNKELYRNRRQRHDVFKHGVKHIDEA